MECEEVVFNGIVFRRYPNSKRRSDRLYYKPSGTLIAAGVEALHREVWKATHGSIPEGYHIHHKDGDTTNNDPENLECVPGSDHLSHHHKGRRRSPELIRHLQEYAKEWHRSAEGRRWHKQHAKEIWVSLGPITRTCEYCGKEYQTRKRGRNRFCSNACRSAYRRKAGLDNVEKVCPICGRVFWTNRFRPAKTCSRECGVRHRDISKRERASVQPYRGRAA